MISYCIFYCRMLLTRESFVIQMIVMEVLKQIMKAAQEDLTERKKSKFEGKKLLSYIFRKIKYTNMYIIL